MKHFFKSFDVANYVMHYFRPRLIGCTYLVMSERIDTIISVDVQPVFGGYEVWVSSDNIHVARLDEILQHWKHCPSSRHLKKIGRTWKCSAL